MQFNRLDKKIKEASKQYQQGYDEQAWVSMERLLDEHLPQKKDRKKIFLWLWVSLSLIILSGIALMLNHSSRINSIASIKQKTFQAVTDNSNFTASKQDNKTASIIIDPINKIEKYNSLLSKNNTIRKSYSSNISIPASNEFIQAKDVSSKAINQFADNNPKVDNENFFTEQLRKQEDFRDQQVADLAKKTIKTLSKEEANNASSKKMTLHPDKNKFKGYVSFNLSAGPDVSAANIGNVGKINIVYGAGVTYQFSKRWNIRTGFYAVKKVYDAKPSDYHPPSSFWIYYPDLKSIDANCKVYEVPLSVSYTITNNRKQRWFASAGLSSYFMKKETYDYISKSITGQDDYRRYTIDNQNKHYLSSLRLSGGYDKKINNKISIGAEPYINLPLTGVGFGKVKLKSTGVLITLGIKAFSKR